MLLFSSTGDEMFFGELPTKVSFCNFILLFLDLQECDALEELYLSHNGIAKMEGLSTLVNLRVLDVSSNKITEINDIANLAKYENQF